MVSALSSQGRRLGGFGRAPPDADSERLSWLHGWAGKTDPHPGSGAPPQQGASYRERRVLADVQNSLTLGERFPCVG